MMQRIGLNFEKRLAGRTRHFYNLRDFMTKLGIPSYVDSDNQVYNGTYFSPFNIGVIEVYMLTVDYAPIAELRQTHAGVMALCDYCEENGFPGFVSTRRGKEVKYLEGRAVTTPTHTCVLTVVIPDVLTPQEYVKEEKECQLESDYPLSGWAQDSLEAIQKMGMWIIDPGRTPPLIRFNESSPDEESSDS